MQGSDRIYAGLVALVDWDGDERDDWLALCRISPTALPGTSRDYYLVITNTEAPILMPRVLGIRDCRNNICEVFDSAGNSPLFTDINSLELMPGDSSVTAPPSQTMPTEPESVREEKLIR
jgi:hypothetical protein